MNKTVLLGRLTKNPEVRHTQNNTVYATFTIAVRRKYQKEGEQDADFINVIAWNKTAEFVSMYFKKGMQIALSGRLQTRSYDANDGTKRYVTEVVAEEVEFAENRKEKTDNEDINFEELNNEEFSIDVDEIEFKE